jgi:hypothetical protein
LKPPAAIAHDDPQVDSDFNLNRRTRVEQSFLERSQSTPRRCHRRRSGSRAECHSKRCEQQSETSRCHRQLELRTPLGN